MTILSKDEARKEVRRRLDEISSRDYRTMSNRAGMKLSTFLSGLLAAKRPLRILAYKASTGWREVDVASVLNSLMNATHDYVPPDLHAPFPDAEYDIVLVPIFGFNDDGYRLGHGSGWYDKFLIRQPHALKVGVGLEASRIDFLNESHDVILDAVVTDLQVRKY